MIFLGDFNCIKFFINFIFFNHACYNVSLCVCVCVWGGGGVVSVFCLPLDISFFWIVSDFI